jgi:hypothetical protein
MKKKKKKTDFPYNRKKEKKNIHAYQTDHIDAKNKIYDARNNGKFKVYNLACLEK